MAKAKVRDSSSDTRELLADVEKILDTEFRRVRVERDLDRLPGLRVVLERLGYDVEAELDRCVPPLYVSPLPNRSARREHGIYFDPNEVERFLSFSMLCRHVKGDLAGESVRPDLWQILYFLAPVFGFRQADGNRFFRIGYLEIPRKNGKSTLAAVISLYLLMADSNLKAGRFFEAGAEVYAAATTKDQAGAVFAPAEAMARMSPEIGSKLAITAGSELIVTSTLSSFKVVSGDPSKAEEKMGGNVSGAVIDETHVHKDARLIETIESGAAGRSQPLVMHLTTAGAEVEGTIYEEKHDFAVELATGKVSGSRTWAVIYTIPPELLARWDDPEVWQAVNPGLGISVSVEYLEDTAKTAGRSARKKNAFLRLHLNVIASSVTQWLPMRLFDIGAAHVAPKPKTLEGSVAFAGLDLASSTDLAACAVVVPRWVSDPSDPEFEIEVLQVLVKAWTPRGSLPQRKPAERELFEKWIREGWITAHAGETIDYDLVESDVEKLCRPFDMRRLSFDRWGSKQIVQHLRDAGLEVAEIGQGFAGISSAMKATERIVSEGRLYTGGNPVLRYAFENVRIQTDAAENLKPDRAKSKGRIDPLVALVMAIDGYDRLASDISPYEEHGLIIA